MSANLMSLPNELHHQILSWCDVLTLSRMTRLNKYWKRLSMQLLYARVGFFYDLTTSKVTGISPKPVLLSDCVFDGWFKVQRRYMLEVIPSS